MRLLPRAAGFPYKTDLSGRCRMPADHRLYIQSAGTLNFFLNDGFLGLLAFTKNFFKAVRKNSSSTFPSKVKLYLKAGNPPRDGGVAA